MSEPNNTVHKKKKFLHWELISIYLFLYDIFAVNFSYFFALFLRFDLRFTEIPDYYLEPFLKFAPIYTVVSILVFYLLRLYNSLWRFASFGELNRIFAATAVTTVFHTIGISVLIRFIPEVYQMSHFMPISYYLVGAFIQFLMLVAIRFVYRYITLERAKLMKKTTSQHRAMIIGGGSAGQVVIKELNSSAETTATPVCIIDDNPNKWKRYIEGVPIVGGKDDILDAAKKYQVDQILFAIPTASSEDRRDILNICQETGCELLALPGIFQLTNGEVSLNKMKPVEVEDLLGRDTIKVNLSEIGEFINNKVIIVTGGGGSIGSELCRQIAARNPKQLIIFDIYENNAYNIEQELKRKYPKLNLLVLIGSVRDSRRLEQIFSTYKPNIVYHAAAHKHVPLMETSPCEAIKNNVIGTYKTAFAALKYNVERFVLISTDKAVNPTNIMGASKRLCEMVIQSMDAISKSGRVDLLPHLYAHVEAWENSDDISLPVSDEVLTHTVEIGSVKNKERTGTQFVAVRFGNVLGSNGSVIPLFKKQIKEGGPVTVTHPDVIRYFMTIPEAVSLVLQAGAYAWGGEIFVLDMGAPVKIDTLARNLIKLSGYTPDVDIEICYTGLRQGEKLFEERLMAEEGIKTTDNELIFIGKPIPFDVEQFLSQLKTLAVSSYDNDKDIVKLVESIVTTFHPVGEKPTGKEFIDSEAWKAEHDEMEKAAAKNN